MEPIRKVLKAGVPNDSPSPPASPNSSNGDLSMIEDLPKRVSGAKRKSCNVSMPIKRIGLDNVSAVKAKKEIKKLKMKLRKAKDENARLEVCVNMQDTELERRSTNFDMEKKRLEEEHKNQLDLKVKDMRDRALNVVTHMKELRANYNKTIDGHELEKVNWAKTTEALEKQVEDQKQLYSEEFTILVNSQSELKNRICKLEQELMDTKSELIKAKDDLKSQAVLDDTLMEMETELTNRNKELQETSNRLKTMDYLRDSCEACKTQMNDNAKKMASLERLESEVAQLRATEKWLKECVADSNARKTPNEQFDLQESTVKLLTSTQSALDNWQQAAREHGVKIDESSAGSQMTTKISELIDEVNSLKSERVKVTKEQCDMAKIQKIQKSLIQTLRTSLDDITKDRDSYRKRLSSREKELSLILGCEGEEGLLSARVIALQKSLEKHQALLERKGSKIPTKEYENLLACLQVIRAMKEMREQKTKIQECIDLFARFNAAQAKIPTAEPLTAVSENASAEAQNAAHDERKMLPANEHGSGEGGSKECTEEPQQERMETTESDGRE